MLIRMRPRAPRLGRREAVQEAQERGTQVLTSGVRELHLPLNPGRPDNSECTTGLYRVVKQGGLSDACFAMQDQDATAGVIEQPVEHLAATRSRPNNCLPDEAVDDLTVMSPRFLVEEGDPRTIDDETKRSRAGDLLRRRRRSSYDIPSAWRASRHLHRSMVPASTVARQHRALG